LKEGEYKVYLLDWKKNQKITCESCGDSKSRIAHIRFIKNDFSPRLTIDFRCLECYEVFEFDIFEQSDTDLWTSNWISGYFDDLIGENPDRIENFMHSLYGFNLENNKINILMRNSFAEKGYILSINDSNFPYLSYEVEPVKKGLLKITKPYFSIDLNFQDEILNFLKKRGYQRK